MDFKNAPKKRTTNFREDETKLLIQLWGSPTVQNKLYLTHRKAPVMRLIAANMQKHGFYRTPDEIKTRIRNLKCLYHRIKKSMTTGHGIGTVDPDWPHYKAMDEILSKKNALRQSLVYNHNLLSEMAESNIKQEIEDIEIQDDCDNDSNTSNSNGSDDEFEESPMIPATVTPLIIEEEDPRTQLPVKIAPKPTPQLQVSQPPSTTTFPRIQIAQNLLSTSQNITVTPKIQTIQKTSNLGNITTLATKIQGAAVQTSNAGKTSGNLPNMPFPLLILNNVPQGVQGGQNNGTNTIMQKTVPITNAANVGYNAEVSKLLRDLLDVQRENLEIEKERLEVEKQKLDFERAVGSQLLEMVPMFNDIFQKFKEGSEPEDTKNFEGHPNYKKNVSSANGVKNGVKRPAEDPLSGLKDSKIFKEAVINGIRKYMQEGMGSSDTDGDSGIANDSR